MVEHALPNPNLNKISVVQGMVPLSPAHSHRGGDGSGGFQGLVTPALKQQNFRAKWINFTGIAAVSGLVHKGQVNPCESFMSSSKHGD